MFAAYRAWSEANAKRPRSETKFGRTIKEKVRKVTKKGRNYYVGICLVNVPQPPDPLL